MIRHYRKLANSLKNALFGGLSIHDCDVETLRRVAMLNSLVLASLTILLPLSLIAYGQLLFQLVFVETILALFLISMVILLRKTGNYLLTSIPTVAAAGLFYGYLVATGGKNNTGFIWVFTYPLIANYLLGVKKGSFFTAMLFIFSGFVFFSGKSFFSTFAVYPINLGIRSLFVYLLITIISILVETTRTTVQDRLNEANSKLKDICIDLEDHFKEKSRIIEELKEAIIEAEQLKRILPICSVCKNVRQDDGYWEKVEKYFQTHSGTRFSHGVCPDCAKEHYSDLLNNNHDTDAPHPQDKKDD
jgi:hypothetical protein